MEKTEFMKWYEEKTGKQAIYWTAFGPEISQEYLEWLEAKANISDEAIKAFQEIIRNQCDEITALKEKAEAYDRLMSGVWHSGKERPTKNGWYCAVYSTNIISDDGISTHPGKDELVIVQFYTKRDVWSYWFTNTRGRLVECINVPKKWMALPDGWED